MVAQFEDHRQSSLMKIIAKHFSATLLAATVLTWSAAVARAEPTATPAKPDEGHTARIIHNLGARMDKVKAKLKYHADKTADRTAHAAEELSERIVAAGKKLDATANKTVEKIGAKLEKLTE